MKPVDNISRSAFTIGKTYRVIQDDGEDESEIRICSIHSCTVAECRWKNQPSLCEEIMFIDEEGDRWCGVVHDFEEIEE